MKLVIGIPTAGRPAAQFLESLSQIVLPPSVTAIEKKIVTGNFVPAQREVLADYAIGCGADYLLMVDDDMVVPPDLIGRLLEPFADEATGIVGALCYSRDGLRPMAVQDWDPRDTTGAAVPAFDDHTPVRVDGLGFGVALIRVAALGGLAPPYFPAQVYVERNLGRVRICNEDYLFCRRLREASFQVVLHPGVRCGHHDRDSGLTYPLTWEDPAETAHARMLVREGDGTVRMRPFDAGIERISERHIAAELDYIFVE